MSEIQNLRAFVKEVYARSDRKDYTLVVDSSLTGEALKQVEERLMRSLKYITPSESNLQISNAQYVESDVFLSIMRRSYAFLYLLYGEEDAITFLTNGYTEVWTIMLSLFDEAQMLVRGDIEGWSKQRILMLILSRYVPSPSVVATLADPLAVEEFTNLNLLIDKYLGAPFARA